MASTTDPCQRFPLETVIEILSNLRITESWRLQAVSKTWQQVLSCPSVVSAGLRRWYGLDETADAIDISDLEHSSALFKQHVTGMPIKLGSIHVRGMPYDLYEDDDSLDDESGDHEHLSEDEEGMWEDELDVIDCDDYSNASYDGSMIRDLDFNGDYLAYMVIDDMLDITKVVLLNLATGISWHFPELGLDPVTLTRHLFAYTTRKNNVKTLHITELALLPPAGEPEFRQVPLGSVTEVQMLRGDGDHIVAFCYDEDDKTHSKGTVVVHHYTAEKTYRVEVDLPDVAVGFSPPPSRSYIRTVALQRQTGILVDHLDGTFAIIATGRKDADQTKRKPHTTLHLLHAQCFRLDGTPIGHSDLSYSVPKCQCADAMIDRTLFIRSTGRSGEYHIQTSRHPFDSGTQFCHDVIISMNQGQMNLESVITSQNRSHTGMAVWKNMIWMSNSSKFTIGKKSFKTVSAQIDRSNAVKQNKHTAMLDRLFVFPNEPANSATILINDRFLIGLDIKERQNVIVVYTFDQAIASAGVWPLSQKRRLAADFSESEDDSAASAMI